MVLFVRTLDKAIAGGTRAVLARTSLYAEAGHRVTLVVTGIVPDGGAWARDAGLLHPRIRLLQLWKDGPRAADHAEAAEHEPIEPSRIAAGPGVTTRTRERDGARVMRTFTDGVLRTQESVDLHTGAPRSFVTYRDDGSRASVWHYVDGVLAAVDDQGDAPGRRTRRFVVDGRHVWLVADISGTEGTGTATLAVDGASTDFAGAIASWLDTEFAASSRLVVFADGENVWQRALRRMRHPGVRGVSVLHNSHLTEPFDASAPTKPHWEGYFSDLTNVDIMVCLTERQRRDLLQRYARLPLRVLRHAAARPRLPRVRREPHTLVSLGRLAPQKQLDHLLRAFAVVLERVPDARLDVYGHGPSEDALVDFAQELGIADHVRFLGRTDRPLEAFSSGRAAVMTSLHEGLPLTLTEALSVGTPFIAYDCNYGPAEVIRDGENGYLVPMGDVGSLADRAVQLLQDDRLARRMGRAARRVTREMSVARYRRAWLEVLADACASR